MKNTATLTILLLSVFITACKKDRVCKCTTTTIYTSTDPRTSYLGASPSGTTRTYSVNTTYKKSKKSDMKTLCADSKHEYISPITHADGSQGSTTDNSETKCELK